MIKTLIPLAICFAALFPQAAANAEGRTVARLFWQNDADASLQWGDLKRQSGEFSLTAENVDGFPKLEPGEQSLVQMTHDAGLAIVGVHDQAGGTIGSGWVALDTGVTEEPHGDHSHWHFDGPPKIVQSLIDDAQGNPAHVYRYGQSFVLANDKKNGFTITSADAIRQAKTPENAAQFFDGGNGHITLAVIEDRVAYATWIAPAGEDMGRVDVIGLGDNDGKRYSLNCPSGGLHGATTNSGKVFLAPSDGICWISADAEMDDDPDSIQINHLSLGSDADDKPLRTGAFTNMGTYVLFTAGKGDQSKLCFLNAASDQPVVGELKLDVAEGQSVMSPKAMTSATGESLACLFVESKDAPETDQMIIVALDPNRDRDFSDAVVKATVSVGRNQMAAHSGHHDAVRLTGGRRIAISNPGDQSIWILSLSDFSVESKLSVPGTPTRLMAIGG